MVTGMSLPLLRKFAMFDSPNERSSHSEPTLYGGGIAVSGVTAAMFIFLSFGPFNVMPDTGSKDGLWLVIGMIVLGLISWFDDIRGVSQFFRLMVHILIVAILLVTVFEERLVFQGWLPPWLDRICAALLWVWFINLFNFMDGIDGISGVQTASIGIGIAFFAGTLGSESLRQDHALVLAGAAVGFLWWNWQPARVFLGDVGSVPLGFLLGWLLLNLAVNGWWLQALILPLYYLVDTTLTLLRRIYRGKKFWEAHRSHYYQQALKKGLSHAQVSRAILIGNCLLIGLAVTSVHAPVAGIAASAAIVFIMLLYFKHRLDD